MDDERMVMAMMNTSDVLHSMTPFCCLCVGFTDFIGVVRWIGLDRRVLNVTLLVVISTIVYLNIIGREIE